MNHTFPLHEVGTSPFTREDYKVFGLQHYPLVGMFTNYMERLLVNAPDTTSKCWLAKVLVDGTAAGSDGDDHAVLYRHFLTCCGVQPGEEDTVVLHSAVRDFIHTHLVLCSQRPFLVGLGALGPGHEWAIPRMFTPIIAGLERAGFEDEEINYFKLHIDQDEDHAIWLEEALASMIQTQEEADQVREARSSASRPVVASGRASKSRWCSGASRRERSRSPEDPAVDGWSARVAGLHVYRPRREHGRFPTPGA